MRELNVNGRALWLAVLAVVGLSAPVMAQEGDLQPSVAGEAMGPEVSLDQAIRIALENNRDLEVARLQLDASRSQVKEAWSAVYPTLNASATYTRNLDIPGQFLPAQFLDPNAGPDELVLVRFGNDNSWFGSLNLEQPILRAAAFIGLGAAARYESLQEEMVRGREQAIVTQTKELYFDVLLAQEAVRLNEESVRRVRQSLEETQAMRRAGLVGDYDVLRLEVELANLEPALRRAENQAEAARRSLAVQLGMDDVEELQVEGSLTAEEGQTAATVMADFGVEVAPLASAEPLIQTARANRSELKQAALTEQLRKAELRAEQSQYLPTISFFANYSFSAQANGGINPFGWNNGPSVFTPQAGLRVSIPLFNGFARPARTSQLRSSLRQAETQTSQISAQVENQVETLYEQVEEARLRAEAQEAAVGQARRGYEIASIQFREGLSGRLELTDAEVALRQSEFNHAQAVHDYLTARAQLDQAVGDVPEAN